jgi:4-amino-4-deoxy-L-arabinose transferase-like glycosyltransferase
MSENVSPVRNNFFILLVPLLSILSFNFLYLFRHIDDNRLTSWNWAFAHMDMVWFVPVLALGLTFAYAISLVKYERYKPALTLFIASFAASAMFWSEPEVIIDVSRYFTYAKHIALYGTGDFLSQWGNAINPWTDLPLVPFVYGLIFKVMGESRIFIQIMNSTLFSFTVVLTYLIGKTLWSSDIGFYAGTMILGIPYIFSQVPLMLVDVPAMFLLTLSVFTFIQVMEKGGAWIYLSSLAVVCAIFSKYSTWMMLSVLAVIFVVYLFQNTDHRTQITDVQRTKASLFRICFQRGLSVVIITITLAGIAFLLKSDVVLSQIAFLREYQAPGLRRWGESFVSTFLFQIHPFITISAIFSIYVAIKKRDLKFLIIIWLIILIVLLQIRRSRYVMVIFPMFTLMASYGLSYLKSSDIKRYIVSSIIAFSLVVAIFAYLPFLKSMSEENIHRAGKLLNALNVKVVRVFTLPSATSAVNPAVSVPVLDLYTNKHISYQYDDNVVPPQKAIEKSPLRFTWEYRNPDYYKKYVNDNGKNTAVVVISNRDDTLPEYIAEEIKGLEQTHIFNTYTGIFRYNPVVTVFQPSQ